MSQKSSRLRIGISACFFHADPKRAIFKGKTLQYVEQSLAQWIQSEDVLTYMIPAPDSQSKLSLGDYAQDLDGLILHGGSDVSPLSYGEQAIKPEWGGDKIRDEYEIALLGEFRKLDKPVFGVCRGLQLMNVAYGGTLYQDIAHALPNALKHRDWDIYDTNFHQLHIEKNSTFSKIFAGTDVAKINSIHHQAVKDVAPGLAVEARSEKDGLVEALRSTLDSWVVAVQWHPEFHQGHAGVLDCRPLLKDFLKQAGLKKAQ